MAKNTETKKIWELYDEISRDVAQSGEAWCNYLDFAARIYKYKFDNALLIYAQNPDATMVAEKLLGRVKSAEGLIRMQLQ